MAKLIRNRRVDADSWQLLKRDPAGAIDIPDAGDVIVPLATWQERRDALRGRAGRTGVWLDGPEGPEALGADLADLPIIAIYFSNFGDGRGFSSARLLRERHGYRGEIRAFGTVIRDWMLFMERCGFDSYWLRDDEEVDNALAAFAELPQTYQASVTEPQPLFRRRAAKAGA